MGVIRIEQVPEDRMFVAQRVRDIVAVEVIGRRSANKQGIREPSARVVSALGFERTMPLKEVVSRYKHPNGAKVQQRKLNTGRIYCLICEEEGERVLFTGGSRNYELRACGSKLQNGYYAVVFPDEQGGYDLTNVIPVHPKVFKKMFSIKREEQSPWFFEIQRKADRNKGKSKVKAPAKPKEQKAAKPKFNSDFDFGADELQNFKGRVPRNSMGFEDGISGGTELREPAREPVSRPASNSEGPKVTVIASAYNTEGRMVGWQAEVRRVGVCTTEVIPTAKMAELCRKGLVDNMCLVKNSSGKEFFRGVDMSIKELPTITV